MCQCQYHMFVKCWMFLNGVRSEIDGIKITGSVLKLQENINFSVICIYTENHFSHKHFTIVTDYTETVKQFFMNILKISGY